MAKPYHDSMAKQSTHGVPPFSRQCNKPLLPAPAEEKKKMMMNKLKLQQETRTRTKKKKKTGVLGTVRSGALALAKADYEGPIWGAISAADPADRLTGL